MKADTKHMIDVPTATGSLDDQAAEWAIYLYSGAATREGEKAFSAWLDLSSAHVQAFRRADQAWRDMGIPGVEGFFKPTIPEEGEAHKVHVLQPAHPARQSGRSWQVGGLALAATVLLAVGIGWFMTPQPDVHHYASQTAEMKTVTLADGTSITLGAETSLTVSYTSDARHVDLQEGTAWFDVAADPNRVFAVQAGQFDVQVVGTAFTVQRRPEGLNLAVGEGAVDISSHQQQAAVRVTAGQQVGADSEKGIEAVQPYDPAHAEAWLNGRLIYRNERLADVVAEINHYRQVKVVLADDISAEGPLADMRVTASFRTEETDKLLAGLEASRPVVIDRRAESVWITAKK